MTLLFAEGFETIIDHIDAIARGLIQNALLSSASPTSTIGVPSRTGFPGKGLFLRPSSGANGYIAANVYPLGGANYGDFGMIPMNQSIYSLWQSGGFAVGFSGSFNWQNYLCPGAAESQQLVYDGSSFYWCVAYYFNGAGWTWGIFYSADLKTWQAPITQPSVNQNSLISIAGSGYGATILISNSSSNGPLQAYYTNNMGMSWIATNVNSIYRGAVYTGGATYPWVGLYYAAAGASPFVTTALGVAPTVVSSVAILPSASSYSGFSKVIGPYVACVAYSGAAAWQPAAGQTSGMGFCLTSADPSQAANWTVTARLANQIVDVVYFNGLFIAGGYGGLYYTSPSNPNVWNNSPSFYGANTAQQSTAFTIFAMACNNNICVAVGTDSVNTYTGAIYTSTDGIHWTKQNRFILSNGGNANTAFNGFTDVIWDGHQFVLCGGGYNGMVLTSPDGFAWEVQYVADNGEATGINSLCFLGVYSGTMNYATNIFTPWNAAATSTNWNGVGVAAAAVVAGQNPALNTRQVAVIANAGTVVSYLSGTAGANATLPCPASPWLGKAPDSSMTNYYELVFTATANPNQFTVQWAVNGVMMSWTSAAVQLAPPADTTGTNQLFFNLPRNGNFTVVDDIYLTNFAGPNNIGRIGPQNIFTLQSTNAGQTQFSNTIGTNSNPQTTNTELSNAEGYIYSGTQGAKDIYNTSNQVPANFNVHAVQIDAFLGVQNPGLAVAGAVGIQQGTSTKTGTAVAPPAPNQARATLLTEVDPKTGAAFTNAGVNTLQMTVTKTT